MVAAWLLWTAQVDAVWMVPVYRHAFEGTQDKTLAPFADRMAWARAMASDVDSRIEVLDVESRLPVPSYTIDTLNHLAAEHADHSFRLVVGADVLDQVDGWRDWPGIQDRFPPIVVGRAGSRSLPDVPVFPGMSSTEIRDRLRRGQSVVGLVTASVAALLAERHPWAD
jgi:nicotinate-nucleotide adenylyltransferase